MKVRFAVIASAFTVAALAVGSGGSAVAAGPRHTASVFKPLLERLSSKHFAQPPTTKECIQSIGIACYAPAQIQKAYDINPLYKQGLDGAGTTIVIVDSFGSPTIQADLATFDADFGLPAPRASR